MIKIALKHFIYEVCIDTLFDSLYKNFVLPKITKCPYDSLAKQILAVSTRIREASRTMEANHVIVSDEVAKLFLEGFDIN